MAKQWWWHRRLWSGIYSSSTKKRLGLWKSLETVLYSQLMCLVCKVKRYFVLSSRSGSDAVQRLLILCQGKIGPGPPLVSITVFASMAFSHTRTPPFSCTIVPPPPLFIQTNHPGKFFWPSESRENDRKKSFPYTQANVSIAPSPRDWHEQWPI